MSSEEETAVSMMKNGFIVVPFKLPETDIYPVQAVHYLFVKKHDNKQNEEESNTLFLFNLPILTHLDVLKTNFNKILSKYETQSIYEKILYLDEFKLNEINLNELSSDYYDQTNSSSKNKRYLPHNTCLLKFVDATSLNNCLSSLRKYSAKSGSEKKHLVVWEGISQPSLKDFTNFYNPLPVDYLKTEISEALQDFEDRESKAIEDLNNASSLVDEDGFTLVVGKNTKNLNSIKRKLLHKNPLTKFNKVSKVPRNSGLAQSVQDKENKKVKLDFYRFQIRERKKNEINELLRKFKDDQAKIKEMKLQKRFNPYRNWSDVAELAG